MAFKERGRSGGDREREEGFKREGGESVCVSE